MDDYTPTTEEVFDAWEAALWEGIADNKSRADADWDGDRMRAQLSRWLASVRADAWDEGWVASESYTGRSAVPLNPYRSGP
jgi:hypothetical protein